MMIVMPVSIACIGTIIDIPVRIPMSTDIDMAVVVRSSPKSKRMFVRLRDDNDDSFGGASAVFPGWHRAPRHPCAKVATM